VTRYPLEIHIYCICSHVITLSAGSSAPFHEQTRYRSSDLVCGGLVVLLLKFLRKNKKKEKNGPLSLGRSTRGIRACCRQRTAFVSHATSYCIPDTYGRCEFVITPTSGRRKDGSRVSWTRSACAHPAWMLRQRSLDLRYLVRQRRHVWLLILRF